MAFKVEEALSKATMADWRNPEIAPIFSKWFKAIFPINEGQADWGTPPKVVITVVKLLRPFYSARTMGISRMRLLGSVSPVLSRSCLMGGTLKPQELDPTDPA